MWREKVKPGWLFYSTHKNKDRWIKDSRVRSETNKKKTPNIEENMSELKKIITEWGSIT